ncbi:uncharacterized protein LOC144743055 [Ciona intestinalis]
MVMPGESTIGSAEKAKIKMSGNGILGNHALVENDGKDVYIQPLADNIQILVNGKVVSGKQKLQDNDRIYFGPNHLYVFNKPQDGNKKPKQPMITFEAAWTEITNNTSFMVNTKIINNVNGVPAEEVKLMKQNHTIQRDQDKVPHFWNLNEEPDLCKVIIHMVMPGQLEYFNCYSFYRILGNHALVENDGKDVYIQPLADNIQILVNGKVVSGKQKLQDNDKIYFGPNHLYVFNKPQDGNKKLKQPMITFEAAWTEITSNKSFMENTKIINNPNGVPPEELKLMKRDHLIQLQHLRQQLKEAEENLKGTPENKEVPRSRICLLL